MDERKLKALELFNQGQGPREIARTTAESGVPIPLGTCARWCATWKRERDARERQARADASFAANPQPLRVLPGGLRADEPGESPEEWSARVLLELRREYGDALARVARPRLLSILQDDEAGATAHVAAAREVREGFAMSDAMCRGASVGAKMHTDEEPEWARDWRKDAGLPQASDDDEPGDDEAQDPAAAAGGVA